MLQLYQGAFCEGESEEFWLLDLRENLQKRFTALLAGIAAQYADQDNPQQAAVYYQAGLDRAPYAIDFYHGLIQLHVDQAESDKALMVHRKYVNVCHRLGLQPSATINSLVQHLS